MRMKSFSKCMEKDQVNFTINKFNEHAEVEYYMIEEDK